MSGRQLRRRRRWIPVALAAAAVAAAAVVARPPAASAKPGVVTNRQGQTFQGDVTEDEQFVYVDAAGGRLALDKRNVIKVDYAADVDAQYLQRHTKLGGADVKGRMDLATWANQQGRPDLAVAVLEEARDIDPANRDVALQLDAVQRQMDLDRRHGKSAAPPQPGGRTPAAAAAAATAPAMAVTMAPALAHRLLTAAEVNAVRQVEMRTDDRLVKIRFDNNVVRKYVADAGLNAKRFAMFTPEEQALEILKFGTPDLAKDVRVLTDPTPLQQFKVKIMPMVTQACGSPSCHGGTKGGDFGLFPGTSTEALYTNFYILQTYAIQIGGVKYLTMDREVPDRSLVLQFGLPVAQGRPPHPVVPELRARFKNRDDPAYTLIDDWLTDSLRVIQPEYGFAVSAHMIPTTKPVPATAPIPATAPAPAEPTHGTPLPRLANGAVTQPSR